MHFQSLGEFDSSEDAAIEFTISAFSSRLSARYILVWLEEGTELRISEVQVFGYEGVDLIKPEFVSSSSGDPQLAVDGNFNTAFSARVSEIDGGPWLWIDFGKMEEMKYASINGICSPTEEEDIVEADGDCQARLILYSSNFESLGSDYIGYEGINTPVANVSFEGSASAKGGITIRVSVRDYVCLSCTCLHSSSALTLIIEIIQAGDFLDPKSVHFSLFTSLLGGEISLQRREKYAANDSKVEGSEFPNLQETRIRLERVNSNFRAFYANGFSTSGIWVPVSSFDAEIVTDFSLGLAVSPGDGLGSNTRLMPSTAILTGTDLKVYNITFDQASDHISHTLGVQRKSENMQNCTAGYRSVFKWDREDEVGLFPLLQHEAYEVFECNPISDMPNYVKQGSGHCADAYNQVFSGITFDSVLDLTKCRSTCDSYALQPGYRGLDWISPSSCRCLIDSSVGGEIRPESGGTGVYEQGAGAGKVITTTRASQDGVLCYSFDFIYDTQNQLTGLCLDSDSKDYEFVSESGKFGMEASFLGCAHFCSSLEAGGPSSGHVGMAYKEPRHCL